MKEETKQKRERQKLDLGMRAELLENEAFHRFLRYMHTNAGEVKQFGVGSWLPGWIVTGCELFFTDTQGRVKEIVKEDDGKWWFALAIF